MPWRVVAILIALVAGVVFLTVCPVKLRPTSGYAHLDRAVAYAVLGFFTALTFRRRPGIAITAILSLAIGLEALQLLVPGRDARFEDALVKSCGGALGVSIAYAMFPAHRLIKRMLSIQSSEQT